ncbi:MAG TPA: bifunctional diguanylate cyclase/phosphodiesterase [Firmicutes bacterium]|nr:bifunctional diguanylate cyclase/phosphodiesterase [Bacillota bacterium]
MDKMTAVKAVFDTMPMAFAVVRLASDDGGQTVDIQLIYGNPAFGRILNHPPEELGRSRFYSLYPEEDKKWMTPFYQAAFEGKKGELHQYSPMVGKYLYINCYPWEERGTCACLVTDESDLVVTHKQLEFVSAHDPLTGLWNRARFHGYIQDFPHCPPRAVGVAFFDINGLKQINDRQGHDAGDRRLRTFANILQQHFPQDAAYRVSGDEFILVCENLPETDFYQRMESFKGQLWQNGESLASCGYIWREKPKDMGELVKKADRLMYLHKNNYYYCNPDDGSRHQPQSLHPLLRDLERRAYVLYLQPKLDLKTGRIYGAEVLARYRDLDGNLTEPARFIGRFEQEGIISYLDFYMFHHLCRHMAEWKGDGLADIRVSVNFSRQTMAESDFLERLECIRKNSGIAPDRLAVEITETEETISYEFMSRVIRGLKERGYAVELDDFGRNTASIEALTYEGIDLVKLDKSLVEGGIHRARTQQMLQFLCACCHELDMGCLLEGVETAEQAEMARRIGCDAMQGFFCAPPMPIENFPAWLARRQTDGV